MRTIQTNENRPLDYGKAITILMVEQDLTLDHIHRDTGWSRGYIASVRTGRVSPQRKIDLWAAALGVATSELVRRAEELAKPRSGEGAGSPVDTSRSAETNPPTSPRLD